jgi:hypothetical protein
LSSASETKIINTAIMRFNEGIIGKGELINAYESGEALIGGITFNQIKTGEEPTEVPNSEKESQANDQTS